MKKIVMLTFILCFSISALAKPRPNKSQCFVLGQRNSHLVVISEIKNNKAKIEYSSSADSDMNFGTLDPDNHYTARVSENVNEVFQIIDNKSVKKVIVKNEIKLFNDSSSERISTRMGSASSFKSDEDLIDGVDIKQRIGFLQASINKVSYKGTARFKLQNTDKVFDMVCEPYRENIF